MPDLAYVGGEFVPLEEALVPLNDRAFYYADAVYEVLTTYSGNLFLFDYHMERLENSLRGVRIPYHVDRAALESLFREGIRRSGYREALIYLQISRCAAPRDKRFPDGRGPNVFATFREKPVAAAERFARGIRILLVPDDRWNSCCYKTVMLLPNVLAHQQALDSGREDAVFFDARERVIYEATSANIFIVKNERYITPNLTNKILPGTVRRHLIALAQAAGLPIEERPVAVDELLAADEVFLTGTTTEVLGVVQVDEQTIGAGVPGPMTHRLHAILRKSVGGA